jgi:hypothetical protein
MPMNIYPALRLFFIAWAICWSQWISAAIITDLFKAKIEISDQSDKNQNKAFSRGLEKVLVKVRGKEDLLSNATVKQALFNASRLIRSYRYEIEGSQLFLVIEFDENSVQSLIRKAGFAVWGKRRPDTLVWLVMDGDNALNKQILTIDSQPDLYTKMALIASSRGIRLVAPIWDLDDRQALSLYDIWGGFSRQINDASERYGVQSILSARIYKTPQDSKTPRAVIRKTLWSADWTLFDNGRFGSGKIQGVDPLTIASQLTDLLADSLSQTYAIDLQGLSPSDSISQVIINNVFTLTDYVQVLAFLNSLSVVDSAQLISQQGPRAIFELRLVGDAEDLINAFSLDKKMQPVIDDFGQSIPEQGFLWVK